MRAIFLGTADGHTSLQRGHSGILLINETDSILLESGAFVAQYLLKNQIDPNIPEAVWLSHMHSDHVGNFSLLIQSLWLRQRKAPLHVFGPGRALEDIALWLKKTILFPELIGFPLHWHPLQGGRVEKVGNFILTPFATDHLNNLAASFQTLYPETTFECYGARIEYGKEIYVHSADVALPAEMRPALEGKVKIVLSELTHFPIEMLFEELAQHQVESVWLTHYPDKLIGQEEELRRVAKACHYTGEVHLAQDQTESKL